MTKYKNLKFVVDQHNAKSAGLHYDLRIQKSPNAKVLLSFAIRKGIPKDGKPYLAVKTPDHPEKWLTWQGTIPDGEYGAGTIKIYDHGTCDLIKQTKKVRVYDFRGTKEKLKGKYALVHMKNKEYLFIKVKNKVGETK